jgi:hypothetical protein
MLVKCHWEWDRFYGFLWPFSRISWNFGILNGISIMGFHPQWLGHTMTKHDGIFGILTTQKCNKTSWFNGINHHPQPHSCLRMGYQTIRPGSIPLIIAF